MKKIQKRICVVSFPMGSKIVVNIFLNDIIEILNPICRSIYIITGSLRLNSSLLRNVKIINIEHSINIRKNSQISFLHYISQIYRILFINIIICYNLIKYRENYDIVFFYVGGGNLFIPIIVAKFLGKKIVTFAVGLGSHSIRNSSQKNFAINIMFKMMELAEKLNFYNSDLIITESKSVAISLGIEVYRSKIEPLGARFLKKNLFDDKNPYDKRPCLVGYIGRLDEGKGVLNFIRAIPLILKKNDRVNFILIGDGPLLNKIQSEIDERDLSQDVKLLGWVGHNRIPHYLNELRLLVLPSFSEGLPTIVVEAMACGTPVLATSVGGIPDVIEHECTGFILTNNSPGCIAENVISALNHPDIKEIANNGKKNVEDMFSYESALNRFKQILKRI